MKVENRQYSILALAILTGSLFLIFLKNNDTDDDILNSRSSVKSISQVSPNKQSLKKSKVHPVQNEELPDEPKLKISGIVNVHGEITDKQGNGIGGLQIEISTSLVSLTPKKLYTSTSDDNGYFIIDGLTPGNEYQLEVLAFGAYAGTLLKPLSI